MAAENDLARATLEEAHITFVDNTRAITLQEALYSANGYRSILGIAKHVAGWSVVYHSFAFEAEPRPGTRQIGHAGCALGHGVRPEWMTDEEAAQFEGEQR